jgi:HKD family nuclease
MSLEKKYSILDEIANGSGYDIALMTTFNFEISFFERAVLNRLYAKEIKKISVFIDAKELTSALQEVDTLHTGSHIGRKYMVNPVRMNSSFHPKVILLLGEKKARLIVGSANIKTSGYATNNEIFNFIDYNPEHTEYLDVIVGAIDFFHKMNEISYQLDNDIIKETKSYIYYHKAQRNSEVYLLQNMTSSILDQVVEIISGDVESVSVAVPYYDKELIALQEIKKNYPNADVILYIQNERSTFPVEYNEEKQVTDQIRIFSRFKDNSTRSGSNFYHGKVFLFKTKNTSYILYGSANCTRAALTSAYSGGGNIECDLLEVGSVDEFNYFFDNIDLIKSVRLTSQTMTFEKSESGNFTFKYGEVKGDIELHIAFSKKLAGLKITVEEQELEYKIEKGELIVTVLEEYRNAINDIFDITISYDGKEEVLRCWTYNPAILANNRTSPNNKNQLDDFDMNATGDKYLEDRIRYFKAEATSLPEWQEYKKNQIYLNQINQEQQGDDGEAEDFIVDFQIPDEYRYAYKQYSALSRIRNMFMLCLFGPAALFAEQTGETTGKRYDVETKNLDEKKARKATSAEKSFERFIKSRVKGMLNEKYVEVIEPEHYLGIIAVLLDIFDKYNNDEKVEGIFDTEYVVDTKIMIFSRLIGKDITGLEDAEEFTKWLIVKCFEILFENHVITAAFTGSEERRKVEFANRAFLLQLEKKYALRDCYVDYIMLAIVSGVPTICTMGMERACQYIEELYDYKNLEQLIKFIQNKYDNATVELKGNSMIINAITESFKDHFRPILDVLKETAKYSRNIVPVDSVTIKIKNVAPNPEGKNIIIQLKHYISMSYHNWRFTETRADGSTYDSKSQFISF